jgi:hypothetical protein
MFVCMISLCLSCAHSSKVSKSEEMLPVVTGAVVSSELLIKGGDLALVAFKAGPKAEANDELDRISLTILKGVKESLDNQKTSLRIIAPNEGQPAVVMEGYIQDFSKPGRISRVMLRPNHYCLSVEGELWLSTTGQRLLNFSAQKDFNPKKEKLVDVAFKMGKEIGNFVAEHTR